ncbi:MAG: DnaA regulatory inactivator Hda [Halieaceae bacterium]|nr:DnaA regulatory inactivator Hda [Halieaceae bacterium]
MPGLSQLPLQVRLRDEATLANFLATAAMKPLLGALRAQATGSGDAVIYLHGPRGSGKSHLLQASCHLAGRDAQYLPLAELAGYPARDVLQGMESLQLVCLDDLHAVLGREDWELALFNLYNGAREQGCRLLLAAEAAPRALALGLEDLRSRLAWGGVFQLNPASDEQKAAILVFRAAQRGIALGPEVANYIVARASRDMEALLALLDHLDHASLVEKRPLSIPFTKRVLGW